MSLTGLQAPLLLISKPGWCRCALPSNSMTHTPRKWVAGCGSSFGVGRFLNETVHGQKGSMHDPLSQQQLDAKFASLVSDSAPPDLALRLRANLADRSRPVTGICESPALAG